MIEVDAEPKQATSSKAGSAKLAALKNAPRVGSKLRNSFQVEKDEQSGDDDIVEIEAPPKKAQEAPRAREDTSGLDLLSAAATVPPPAPKLAAATLPASASSRAVSPPPLSKSLFSTPSTYAPPSAPATTSAAPTAPAPIAGPSSEATGSNATRTPSPPSHTPSGSGSSSPAPPASRPETTEEIKAYVASLPLSALPVFHFDIPVTIHDPSPSMVKARLHALTVPLDELPKFDFSLPLPLPKALPKTFDWAAAGLSKPAAQKEGEWVCDECTLTNPASATAKCEVCDAPRPGVSDAATSAAASTSSAPAEPPKTFDWAAAGLSKPAAQKEGEWVCGSCTLKNPASALSKCSICDEPRPGAAAAAASTSTAAAAPVDKPKATFDWAAAGMQQPQNGGWTCKMCMVKNKASATKCAACEAERP